MPIYKMKPRLDTIAIDETFLVQATSQAAGFKQIAQRIYECEICPAAEAVNQPGVVTTQEDKPE